MVRILGREKERECLFASISCTKNLVTCSVMALSGGGHFSNHSFHQESIVWHDVGDDVDDSLCGGDGGGQCTGKILCAHSTPPPSPRQAKVLSHQISNNNQEKIHEKHLQIYGSLRTGINPLINNAIKCKLLGMETKQTKCYFMKPTKKYSKKLILKS